MTEPSAFDGVEDGTRVEATLRLLSNGNAAVQPYRPVEVPMFLHTLDDGQRVLLVEQEWLDTVDVGEAERARSHFDGMPADPAHPLLEAYEVSP